MKIAKRFIVTWLTFVVLCGCDYTNKQNAETAREEKVREANRLASETENLRVDMLRFAEGKSKLQKEALEPLEKSAAVIRNDVDAFATISAAIMSEKDKKGVELPLENRLLHLMRDAKVNELASRYLMTDFARDAAMFVELIRTAREEDRRYANAKKMADELYEQSLSESEKWTTATREQRDAELERLKREIASLEASRKVTLKEYESVSRSKLHGGVQHERTRQERIAALRHQLSDADNEIAKKRKQIDLMRDPDTNRRMESRAADERQQIHYRANIQRDTSLRDIDRNMKPKRSVVDIISEYEKKTTGLLQKVMADELDKQQKQVAAIQAKVRQLEDAQITIPVSNKDELLRMRKALQD